MPSTMYDVKTDSQNKTPLYWNQYDKLDREMAYRQETKVSSGGSSSIGNGLPTEDSERLVVEGVVQLEMAYRLKTKVSSGWSSSIGNGLPTEDKG